MKTAPILFSAPMVTALLAGTKTQTRRVLSRARVFATPDQPAFTLAGDDLSRALQNADRFRHLDGNGWFWEADAFPWQAPSTRTGWMAHIGYAPGDRLYVREAFRPHGLDTPMSECSDLADIMYRANADEAEDAVLDWKPSIHMPRWASRLTLIVTDVRVERLQDISEADAIAEGVEPVSSERDEHDWSICPKCGGTGLHGALGANLGVMEVDCAECDTHVKRYRHLWEGLNAERGFGWDANPWVTATTFTVHHGNIDQIGRPA